MTLYRLWIPQELPESDAEKDEEFYRMILAAMTEPIEA